jgi:uncharacterized delta-60 repeat protein
VVSILGFGGAVRPLRRFAARAALALVTTLAVVQPSFSQPSSSASPTGTAGTVTTDFGSLEDASAVAIQPDGKIVVAGSAGVEAESESGQDFALVRYTPEGSLDLSFGTGGRVTTDFGGKIESAEGIAVLRDGKIVVVVSTGNDLGDGRFESAFAVARYAANGSPDRSFGNEGKVITSFGLGDDVASDVALQADGKIVVAGSSNNGFLLVR